MASVIKSIQQVSVTLSSVVISTTATLVIPVDTTKSIIIPNGMTSSDANSNTFQRNTILWQLTSSNIVTASRSSATPFITGDITVIEFNSGVNSIQNGTIGLTTASALSSSWYTQTAAISGVSSNAFIIYQGMTSQPTALSAGSAVAMVNLVSSIQVQALGVSLGAGASEVVGYMVADLDSTIVSGIQELLFQSTTVPSTITNDTFTITAVATNLTLLIDGGHSLGSGAGVNATGQTQELVDATTVRWSGSQSSGVGNIIRGRACTVVTFNSAVVNSAVQRGVITITAGTTATTTTLGTQVVSSYAFVNCVAALNCKSTLSLPRNTLATLVLTSGGSAVTATLNSSTGATDQLISYEVLELSAGATFVYVPSDTWGITLASDTMISY